MDYNYFTTTSMNVMNTALTFDDVQILPQYSTIGSRNDVSLKSELTTRYSLESPFIASPMPDVCETDMAIAMWEAGGVGVVHRFMTIEEQVGMITAIKHHIIEITVRHRWNNDLDHLRFHDPVIAAAIGVTEDYIQRATALLNAGVNVFMIDVAHGHHSNVKLAMKELRKLKSDYNFDVIAGTIATPEAAVDLIDWGADALRVGVGGGSACETRIRTGIGVPQLQSVIDVAEVADEHDIPIVSDGGIRYPGDVAKAIVGGASTVMIGNLFAGTDEAPGIELITGRWPDIQTKRIYKGAASASQKLNYNGAATYVEGATKIISSRGPVNGIVDSLKEGLRSSMSYVGASDIDEFFCRGQFIRITQAGMVEAHPHMLFEP